MRFSNIFTLEACRFKNSFIVKGKFHVQLLISGSTTIREWQAMQNSHIPLLAVANRKPGVTDLPDEDAIPAGVSGELNTCQLKMVQHAVVTKQGFALLQGPPGTGKTRTVVAILEALCVEHKRVLVCAPSNAAVDEIALRLMKQAPGLKLVRVGVPEAVRSEILHLTLDELSQDKMANDAKLTNSQHSCEVEEVRAESRELNKLIHETHVKRVELPDEDKLLPTDEYRELTHELCSLHEQNNSIKSRLAKLAAQRRKSKEQMERLESEIRQGVLEGADVVLCTLSSAAHEQLAKVRGGFEVVIVDEATQATEPSTMIPLELGCKKCILVGDPQQLPPTVHSGSRQLELSLFERLMDAGHPVKMLQVQYRMHPLICAFPSKHFYSSNLRADSSLATRQRPSLCAGLQPLSFIDTGQRSARREGNGWANSTEAEMISEQVWELLEGSTLEQAAEIGIIAPYRAQVKEIRRCLERTQRSRDRKNQGLLSAVEVSTVDGFQGREKDVVLISIVRDRDRGLGFVKDHRRMNVAITRAKHALVLVGNASSLENAESDDWTALLRFVKEEGLVGQARLNSHKRKRKEHNDDVLNSTKSILVTDSKASAGQGGGATTKEKEKT